MQKGSNKGLSQPVMRPLRAPYSGHAAPAAESRAMAHILPNGGVLFLPDSALLHKACARVLELYWYVKEYGNAD